MMSQQPSAAVRVDQRKRRSVTSMLSWQKGLMRSLTRTRVVWMLIVSGALIFWLTSTVWVYASVTTAVHPNVAISALGTDAAPVVSASALVVLASGPALALVGRRGRYVVLTVGACGGAGAFLGALMVMINPRPVAVATASQSVGITEITGPVTLAWPVGATAVVGCLTVIVAIMGVFAVRNWPGASQRHSTSDISQSDRSPVPYHTESAPQGEFRAITPDATQDWDALTRGEDPSQE